jgi:hypothetical protein
MRIPGLISGEKSSGLVTIAVLIIVQNAEPPKLCQSCSEIAVRIVFREKLSNEDKLPPTYWFIGLDLRQPRRSLARPVGTEMSGAEIE